MLEQRVDMQMQRQSILDMIEDDADLTLEGVRGGWSELLQQGENSTLEPSTAAAYARLVVQQGLAASGAAFSVPPELVRRHSSGRRPRPAQLMGCFLVSESGTGRADLEKQAKKLQEELGLLQPWGATDPAFLAALEQLRDLDVLVVQTLIEKTVVLHQARARRACTGVVQHTHIAARTRSALRVLRKTPRLYVLYVQRTYGTACASPPWFSGWHVLF